MFAAVTHFGVNSTDGTQMWSERYDRGEGDVFDIQEEIATAIVKNLKGRLLDSQTPAVRRATDHFDAYKLYLKGRYCWERRNRGALQNAVMYFEQAITADPDYALAHAGLADCHTVMGIYSIRPTRELRPRALDLAMRALQLDPDLPEAHCSLGAEKFFLERNWAAANSAFSRALELDPRLAVALGYRAVMLVVTKTRPQDGIADCIQAMKLEPDSTGVAEEQLGALHDKDEHTDAEEPPVDSDSQEPGVKPTMGGDDDRDLALR